MISTLACTIALSVLGAAATVTPLQATARSAPYRVQLKVSADETLRTRVRQALEERLRSIADVQVVEGAGDFTLSVIVLQVVNRSARLVGATFSVLVTVPYTDDVRRFADTLPPDRRDALLVLVPEAVRPVSHWVQTAAAEDLVKVCRGIVEAFEKEALAPARKAAKAPTAAARAPEGHLAPH